MRLQSMLTHLSDKAYAIRHPFDRMTIRRRYSEPAIVALPKRTHNVVLQLRAA